MIKLIFKAKARWEARKQTIGIARWKDFVNARMERRQEISRALRHWKLTEKGRAFRTWETNVQQRMEMRDMLAAAMASWKVRAYLLCTVYDGKPSLLRKC